MINNLRVSVMKNQCFAFLMFFGSVLFSLSSAATESVESLKLMGVNPGQGQAVIQFSDESMKVIKVGEQIGETGAVVTHVLPDKIIAEQTSAKDKSMTDVLWIFRVRDPGKVSEIQRFEKTDRDQKTFQQPVTRSVKLK